jgi:hypothetical protein
MFKLNIYISSLIEPIRSVIEPTEYKYRDFQLFLVGYKKVERIPIYSVYGIEYFYELIFKTVKKDTFIIETLDFKIPICINFYSFNTSYKSQYFLVSLRDNYETKVFCNSVSDKFPIYSDKKELYDQVKDILVYLEKYPELKYV